MDSRPKDLRKRRDFIAKQANTFNGQMSTLTDAYLEWGRAVGGRLDMPLPPVPETEVLKELVITAVDIFTLILRGLVPCAPFKPSVAFSIPLLELFRVAHLRTPQLSIQAWLKTIADVYLAVLKSTKLRVMRALGRDDPKWCIKNNCASCTYKLEDEEPLTFSMMTTMDGNNSLKRVLRKEPQDFDEQGDPLPGVSSERFDPRTTEAGGDYFIPRERVNMWDRERLKDMGRAKTVEDKSACEDRWKNLGDDGSKKMWAVYDETGIFLCLCRHGSVLTCADMVRSGELSKYPLAVVEELLDAFGAGIAGGFDVGCGLATTLWNSPLGSRALLQNFCCMVGAFHGHAHNRLCQLKFLATYIKGLGLEDLEGCERFFSRSNANAGSVRYASAFHRLQALTTYFAYFDSHETYANLSKFYLSTPPQPPCKFLVDNYWQALVILEGEPALRTAMRAAGIEDESEFTSRLDDEFQFLKGLMVEAEEDTAQMEYYQRLVNLADRRYAAAFSKFSAADVSTLNAASTATPTARRHARENYDKALGEVQESEMKMGVETRWVPEGPEWAEAAHLVSTRRYRLALLKLERLVIQRMFELTKMNLSQTGYKLRKHIAKALQARSQAIRNALKTYNAAAGSIVPSGRTLTWSEVVEYAFLADFDLLRDPEKIGEVREWATPAARLLLDKYFKIERAREEIIRCNIEIRRLVTHIRDEAEFFAEMESKTQASDPGLAWAMRKHRFERSRYNSVHMERFRRLAKKAGTRFTGTLSPGVCLKKPSLGLADEERDIDDDVGERAEGEELAEELHTVFVASNDAD
ncbi:hypothetical protein C8R46DRAFT_1160846 [Mycena filopes]|nr:hypothetical protein C8R46DRAFT_1160846 [Mycena filopes]